MPLEKEKQKKYGCIVGNVVTKFWQEEECMEMQIKIFLTGKGIC